MAKRVQAMCRGVVGPVRQRRDPDLDGGRGRARPAAARRRAAGFGKQKAQIFVALLGKQYGVDVTGWREAAGDYGREGTYKSVADIADADSLARVRDYKKQVKGGGQGAGV
jgi:uncharacterized HhH-GPD family protein